MNPGLIGGWTSQSSHVALWHTRVLLTKQCTTYASSSPDCKACLLLVEFAKASCQDKTPKASAHYVITAMLFQPHKGALLNFPPSLSFWKEKLFFGSWDTAGFAQPRAGVCWCISAESQEKQTARWLSDGDGESRAVGTQDCPADGRNPCAMMLSGGDRDGQEMGMTLASANDSMWGEV